MRFFFIISFLFPVVSFAEVVIAINNGIYRTSLKRDWALVSKEASLIEAQFVQFPKGKDSTYQFSIQKVTTLPNFSFLQSEKKSSFPPGEGCGQYPLMWLNKSIQIASMKSKDLYIQVPAGASVNTKYPEDLPEVFLKSAIKEIPSDPAYTKKQIIDMLKKSVTVQSAEKTLVFVDWGKAELNQQIIIFEKSKTAFWISEWLTVTDECP